jgi:hypothetical protein
MHRYEGDAGNEDQVQDVDEQLSPTQLTNP